MDIVSTYNELNKNINTSPLSELLPLALKLSIELNANDFTKWLRLEYEGYFNTNTHISSDIIVPEYRTIVGNYVDSYGHLIRVQDPKLSFINEYRLRHGVAELETLIKHDEFINIQDNDLLATLNNNFHVDAYCFKFSPSCVQAILSSIRAKLIDYLSEIQISYDLKPKLVSNNKPKWTRDNKIGCITAIILHNLK